MAAENKRNDARKEKNLALNDMEKMRELASIARDKANKTERDKVAALQHFNMLHRFLLSKPILRIPIDQSLEDLENKPFNPHVAGGPKRLKRRKSTKKIKPSKRKSRKSSRKSSRKKSKSRRRRR